MNILELSEQEINRRNNLQALKELGRLAQEGKANLNLMGIEPTYPSEKYGYIIPQTKDTVSTVETFK